MEWVIKRIRLWQDFPKVAKHGFKECLWWKGFLCASSYRPYMFSIRKNHKINLLWCKAFFLKSFTKLVKMNFRGSKATKSHLSNFPFSICLNLYQNTILHLVKTFRFKTFKKSMKTCHERMQSWTNYQFRFKTRGWGIAEYYLPKSDYCILQNKFIPIRIFWLIGSKATRYWNRNP